jgi:hypothetical protein
MKNGPPPVCMNAVVTARRQVRREKRLAAQTQTLDERAVTRDVDVLQVAQQAATLSNEQQQATT